MTLRHLNQKELKRFLSFIKIEKNGCWNWVGYVRKNGYGVISYDCKQQYAHRISYFNFVGNIPKNKEIDHLCRNRRCVNPRHLEVVTRSENTKRGLSGELSKIRHSEITHCPHGHEYTSENTYLYKNRRGCRMCRRFSFLKYKEKQL